jgi:Caspase domain
MRIVLLSCCTLLAVLLGAGRGIAQSRVALVIGNSAYQNVPALRNPVNDANDVSASLVRLGFQVSRVNDGTFDDMRRALRDFAQMTQGSEIALVFFSGHGMEIAGENWLIPTDAQLKTELTADQEAVALKSVMPIVGAASKLGIIILDACRSDPFAASMQRGTRTRAVERGLKAVEPTGSVLVAFAAKEGTTADDGTGRNSPFTAALLSNVERPGLEVNYLFRSIREAVLHSTDHQQEPVVYGSLPSAEIYLRPPNIAAGSVTAPVRPDAPSAQNPAEQAWQALQNTRRITLLEAFIRQYGESFYADLARARIAELQRRSPSPAAPSIAAPVVPPAAPTPAAPPQARPPLLGLGVGGLGLSIGR